MFEALKWLRQSKKKAVVYWCLLSFCLAVKGTYVESRPRENPVERHPRVLDVLSDFQFVGMERSEASLDSHLIKPQDLPREFETGIQYIWLKKGYADNEKIFKILQDRLRVKGITILDATGKTNRFIGGLAFKISFQDGPYKGTLFNIQCQTVSVIQEFYIHYFL